MILYSLQNGRKIKNKFITTKKDRISLFIKHVYEILDILFETIKGFIPGVLSNRSEFIGPFSRKIIPRQIVDSRIEIH